MDEKSNYRLFVVCGGFVREFDGLTKRKYMVSPHHCPFCGVEERFEYCESEADSGA